MPAEVWVVPGAAYQVGHRLLTADGQHGEHEVPVPAPVVQPLAQQEPGGEAEQAGERQQQEHPEPHGVHHQREPTEREDHVGTGHSTAQPVELGRSLAEHARLPGAGRGNREREQGRGEQPARGPPRGLRPRGPERPVQDAGPHAECDHQQVSRENHLGEADLPGPRIGDRARRGGTGPAGGGNRGRSRTGDAVVHGHSSGAPSGMKDSGGADGEVGRACWDRPPAVLNTLSVDRSGDPVTRKLETGPQC